MQEDTIVSIVCVKLDIERDLVFKKTRKREIVYAKYICMLMMLFFTDRKHHYIGMYFGMRDHTAVQHARKTMADLIETDQSVKSDVVSIFKSLYHDSQCKIWPDRSNKIEIMILSQLLHA